MTKKLKGEISRSPKYLVGKIAKTSKPEDIKLQDKTFTPSHEVGYIFPDSGYDGLSSVKVEAANLQEKTVTPTTAKQTVTADHAYYGLKQVNVEAVQLQEKTVIPSVEAQEFTPGDGYMGFSKIQVSAARLQEKSVSPTGEAQTLIPDGGYYGMNRVNVAAAPLQEKTVTPTTEEQTITPDAGNYGLSSVNVGAVELEELTVTPSTEQQELTPAEGYIGFSKVTVEAAESGGSGGDSGETDEPEELQSAEDLTFDFDEADEYCLSSPSPSGSTNSTSYKHQGYRVKPEQDVIVKAIRMYVTASVAARVLTLWTHAGELLASITTPPTEVDSGRWVEFPLETPVQLTSGTWYIFAIGRTKSSGSWSYSTLSKSPSLNSKFNSYKYTYCGGNDTTPPGNSVSSNWPAVDMVLGTELSYPVSECKVQYTTLELLANEVKRITGDTGIQSVYDMIVALQGVPSAATT